jgi:hypothetical protein
MLDVCSPARCPCAREGRRRRRLATREEHGEGGNPSLRWERQRDSRRKETSPPPYGGCAFSRGPRLPGRSPQEVKRSLTASIPHICAQRTPRSRRYAVIMSSVLPWGDAPEVQAHSRQIWCECSSYSSHGLVPGSAAGVPLPLIEGSTRYSRLVGQRARSNDSRTRPRSRRRWRLGPRRKRFLNDMVASATRRAT